MKTEKAIITAYTKSVLHLYIKKLLLYDLNNQIPEDQIGRASF